MFRLRYTSLNMTSAIYKRIVTSERICNLIAKKREYLCSGKITITQKMKEIIELINQMSPYILLGFLLAGLMHAFVPNGIYRKYLGGGSLRSVINAALLGVPLPLCSCGVIPTAMSLRREGASRGATVAFLISTPQTGVDSIIATYSLMGLPFALLRPIVAFITAIFGGFLVNRVEAEKMSKEEGTAAMDNAVNAPTTLTQKISIALKYAYVDMIQDIGRWLMVGLVVAGLITVFVPDSFFSLFADNSLLSMLMVLLFSIPMYLCATGSIPIAVALMIKGLSPGTALVLLMAGPAVNAASMLVISKVMGKKTMMLYLTSIIAGAMGFGLAIDHLLPREWFITPLADIHSCAHASHWFHILCTALLGIFLINAFVRKYRGGNACTCHQDSSNACQAEEEKNVMVVYVKGMNCNHCKANVEKAIRSISGVEDVEIDLTSGETQIHGKTDRETIKDAVESIGFSLMENPE